MTRLETERLIIREFRSADWRPLLAVLGDPAVMEYSVNGPMGESAVREFVASCRASYRECGHGQWAVVERGSLRLLGFCGISPVELDGAREVELAYRLASDCWGQGLASEAGAAVLAAGFSRRPLDSVVAIIARTHVASQKVAGKLGFAVDYCTTYRGWDVAVYRRWRAPG